MKTRCVFRFLALLISVTSMAADNKYVEAMKSALADLQNSKTVAEILPVANRLEQIAAGEPREWLPLYWASFSYTLMSFMDEEDDRRDQFADKAEELLNKAALLQKDDAEISILRAYISQARLAVSPMTRWASQGTIFKEHMAKAKEIAPGNPRIYYLEGQNIFHTPDLFGGGKEAAKPLLKKALNHYASFKPASGIHPDWGMAYCQKLYAQCNE